MDMSILLLIGLLVNLIGTVVLAVLCRHWISSAVGLTVDATDALLTRQDDKIEKRLSRRNNTEPHSMEESLLAAGQPLRRH